jgi:hypothetical protein
MQKNNKVVARLTVIREVGCKTIIEVQDDATFSRFYHFYMQEGNRRSTKRAVRAGSRNEGIPSYQVLRARPGLERLADAWQKQPGVVSVKLRILRKRAYLKLIDARPDQLGLTKMSPVPLYTTYARAAR